MTVGNGWLFVVLFCKGLSFWRFIIMKTLKHFVFGLMLIGVLSGNINAVGSDVEGVDSSATEVYKSTDADDSDIEESVQLPDVDLSESMDLDYSEEMDLGCSDDEKSEADKPSVNSADEKDITEFSVVAYSKELNSQPAPEFPVVVYDKEINKNSEPESESSSSFVPHLSAITFSAIGALVGDQAFKFGVPMLASIRAQYLNLSPQAQSMTINQLVRDVPSSMQVGACGFGAAIFGAAAYKTAKFIANKISNKRKREEQPVNGELSNEVRRDAISYVASSSSSSDESNSLVLFQERPAKRSRNSDNEKSEKEEDKDGKWAALFDRLNDQAK